MNPDRYPRDDPREWLNRARSNLAHAKAQIPGVYLEDLCFDAQRAAEKAIKAVFIARRVTFPFIHDLAELLTLLQGSGEDLPLSTREAGWLTRFAVVDRYPGLTEPVSENDYASAIGMANAVVTWAEMRVRELAANAER